MTNNRDIYQGGRTQGVAGWGTTELSKQQVRKAVTNAIASLETKGIRPCEILHALAEQAQQQGNRKAADMLLKAAFELRQGEANDLLITDSTPEMPFDDSFATPVTSTLLEGDERRRASTDFGF